MNLVINFLLVISVIVIVITQFVIDEPSSDILKKMTNIFVNMSYSYIVAYIFYLVAFFPDRKNKKELHRYILLKSGRVVGVMQGLLTTLTKTQSIKDVSDDEIIKMCRNINPHADAPMVIGPAFRDENGELLFNYANWAQYILEASDKIPVLIDEVKKFSYGVDPDLMKSLINVQESSYFFVSDSFLRRIEYCRNQDLMNMEKQFIEIKNRIHDLDKCNENLKKRYGFK